MELAAVLDRQDGLLTRRQATEAGLTLGGIEHRLRSGRWRAVLPGTYATFTGTLSAHQRATAALLYGGPACLLGGPTAAGVHGLHQVPRSRTVYLLLPHRLHRSERSFVRIRRATTMPAPELFDELRTVPVARAVVDACRELSGLNRVRALVAESVQRRKTTVAALRDELDRGGSAGSASVRFVLDEVAAGARSVAEAVGAALLARTSLPAPAWNRDLFTLRGEWLARPDAWWREAGVVLEIDSQEWHLLPEQWAATMQRHARMTSFGLLVVHVTPRRLGSEPDEVAATLARTIDHGRRRPTPPVTDVPPPGWRGLL